MSRRALGKGLGALIPTSADVDLRDDVLQEVPGVSMRDIPVADIRPNPNQPRQQFDEEALAELVHSLREVGLLQRVEEGHFAGLHIAENRFECADEARVGPVVRP